MKQLLSMCLLQVQIYQFLHLWPYKMVECFRKVSMADSWVVENSMKDVSSDFFVHVLESIKTSIARSTTAAQHQTGQQWMLLVVETAGVRSLRFL
jgi:hypothetical protein